MYRNTSSAACPPDSGRGPLRSQPRHELVITARRAAMDRDQVSGLAVMVATERDDLCAVFGV
jgi:hypothetical protein